MSIIPTLSWSGGDPDSGDTVSYDVYFDTGGATTKVSSGQTPTAYIPVTLKYATTYYWKIVARDNNGAETEGNVWSFTTKPNTPPIANAGPDQIVTTGSKVIIDGSKSYDPGGDSLTWLDFWSWSMVSMPAGSKANVSSKATSILHPM